MKSQSPRKASKKSKVFVGMSGGVDSSVSVALLVKAGYDVTGVFIKVWQPDWIECNWKEELLDAMRAAAHIGIPFVTLDLVKEYKKGVIDYMISEYRAGRTPNPDVMCNREVKFGAFWCWAKKHGADFIATGHYARLSAGSASPSSMFELHKGIDSNKDQSYFLWTLTQDDLRHVLFPVGHLTKPEVRKLASKFKLPNAEKRDSQGLCFIGKVDVKAFLAHYIHGKKGNVLDENGEIIGTHPGALFFTLGERHGFIVTKKTPSDAPYFVVSKDNRKNTITVSHNKLLNIRNMVTISECNWVRAIPSVGQTISIRTRYRQQLIKATVAEIRGTRSVLKVDELLDPATPGQSLVAYDGDECLGGGIIEAATS